MAGSTSPRPDRSGDPNNRPGSSNRRELLRYAGLSSQVFGSVGISLFLGIKADKWLHVSFPLLSWGLPLLVIVLLIVKLIKESSQKKDGK